ncbi:hypothetical protein Q8F55_009169 [Vanrija albida]|uniref:Transcription factor IIIC putative zinc-finger domain-containing protein n=1 Tax=Vanrija albida TaxID=181172 RepID=A0ABR3PSV7_9TREE
MSSSNTRPLPVLITSRRVPGRVASLSRRNVSWSADGQCLLVSRHGVSITTPHLISTLPAPSVPLNSSIYDAFAPKSMLEDGDDEPDVKDEIDVDGDDAAAPPPKIPRPGGGEVRWWMTSVQFDSNRQREDVYEWADVGDEYSAVLTDNNRHIRGAAWSPSCLSRIGSAVVAVLTNSLSVSMYEPAGDPHLRPFGEATDLSITMMGLLGPEVPDGKPTTRGMLRMRFTCLEWSEALPLQSMIGLDGSLLALGNRAGGIAFWRYANAVATLVAEVPVIPASPWVVDLTWGKWQVVDDTTCVSTLALAGTDGSVRTLVVRRTALHVGAPDVAWGLELGEPAVIAAADRRAITGLKWLTDDLVMWTKAGTVHFWQAAWGGVKSLRLQPVGNWAGSTPLAACAGIHFLAPSTVLLVLGTLTHHVILDVTTEPKLAPVEESLRLSLAARDAFLDVSRNTALRNLYLTTDLELTASTAGYVTLGSSFDIATWLTEPLTLHNLDSLTEVHRIDDFIVADLKHTHTTPESIAHELQAVLADPPRLYDVAPLVPLLSPVLRTLTSDDTTNRELLLPIISDFNPDAAAPSLESSAASPLQALIQALWAHRPLDQLRLRLILAYWGQRTFPGAYEEFTATARALESTLRRTVATVTLEWAVRYTSASLGATDSLYLHHLIALSGGSGYLGARLVNSATSADGTDSCPACKSEIPFVVDSSARCVKGHEWERCSVTHFPITTPEYRLCPVCPAVSLIPRSQTGGGGEAAVANGAGAGPGADAGDAVVQLALEAAVHCVMCGGRWSTAL